MNGRDSLWVVVHMARTRRLSDEASRLLIDEGFVIKTRKVAKALERGRDCYEIYALPSEARQARDILHEAGL